MSKFAIDKNFDSIRSGLLKSKKNFELTQFGDDEYTLLEHMGDSVGEIATFTKEELKTLWIMLTSNE